MKKSPGTLLGICLLATFTLSAEKTIKPSQEMVIYLNNGDIIRGTTESAPHDIIKVTTANGTLMIHKADIKRMISKAESMAENEIVVKEPEQKPAGKTLRNEDILTRNILPYIIRSLAKADIQGIKTVAIRKIKVSGGYDFNDKVFETKIIDLIVKRKFFTVLERQALEILLKEQQMSLTGLEESDESKVGKMIGVDAFITVEASVISEHELRVYIKMIDVEKGTVIWEDKFKGEYFNDFKMALGLFASPGAHFDHAFDSQMKQIGPVTFGYNSGNFLGLSFHAGTIVPAIRALELDFGGDIMSDLISAPNENQPFTPATGSISFTPRSTLVFNITPVILKLHPSEFFNSPNDIIRFYASGGILVTEIFQNNQNNQAGQMMNSTGNQACTYFAFSAGLEFAPVRNFSIFLEASYSLPNQVRIGLNYPEDFIVTNPLRFRLGVLYSLFD